MLKMIEGDEDRIPLLACWEAWGKPPGLSQWGSYAPIEEWQGVTTNELGRVVGLKLSGCYLKGPIPEAVGNLTQLVELDLRSNLFEGPIPEAVGNLTQLTSLHLHNNQLEGPIPEAVVGKLTQLQGLYLSCNKFKGPIPEAVGNLTQLQELWLTRNQFEGPIPEAVGNLTQLTILGLNDNQLEGPIPEAVGKLTQLQQLDLSSNQFKGTLPKGLLTNLANLEAIDVSNNDGLKGDEDRGPLLVCWEAWDKPPELEKWGSHTPIGKWQGVTTNELGRVVGLQLSGCSLNGFFSGAVGNLAQLVELDLSNNQLEGPIPEGLSKLIHLKTLYLNNNQFKGPMPEMPEEGKMDIRFDPANDRFALVAPRPKPLKSRFSALKLLLVGTGLGYFDLVSDILTALEYLSDGHEGWFAISASLILLSLVVSSVTFIREMKQDREADVGATKSLLLGVLHLHPLFLAWRSFKGEQEHPTLLRTKFDEAICESGPQLLLQTYVIMARWGNEEVPLLLKMSVAVSFATLSHTSTVALDRKHVDALMAPGPVIDTNMVVPQDHLLEQGEGENNNSEDTNTLAETLCALPYLLTRALSIASRGLSLVLLATSLRGFAFLVLPVMLLARCLLIYRFDKQEGLLRGVKLALLAMILEGIMPDALYGYSTVLVAVESAGCCVVALTSPSVVSPRPFPASVTEYAVWLVAAAFVLRLLLDAAFLPAAAVWRRGGTAVARGWVTVCRRVATSRLAMKHGTVIIDEGGPGKQCPDSQLSTS